MEVGKRTGNATLNRAAQDVLRDSGARSYYNPTPLRMLLAGVSRFHEVKPDCAQGELGPRKIDVAEAMRLIPFLFHSMLSRSGRVATADGSRGFQPTVFDPRILPPSRSDGRFSIVATRRTEGLCGTVVCGLKPTATIIASLRDDRQIPLRASGRNDKVLPCRGWLGQRGAVRVGSRQSRQPGGRRSLPR